MKAKTKKKAMGDESKSNASNKNKREIKARATRESDT